MSTEIFSAGPSLIATQSAGTIRLALHDGSGLVCKDFPKAWLDWVDSYVQGGQTEPIDLNLEHLSPFRQEVLKALREVPRGSTVTYGELASNAGKPGAARAVGSSCRLNPYPLLIPCHRVVASNGLGGFAYPLNIKLLLLEFDSGTLPAST